jgi:integrase/recombinase XerD
VTQLRKMMLEELKRRNYSQRTVRSYVTTVDDLARYFHRSPDELGPDRSASTRRTCFASSVPEARDSSAKDTQPGRSCAPDPLSNDSVLSDDPDDALWNRSAPIRTGAFEGGQHRHRAHGDHVEGGKGRKDRDVMLSPKLLEALREHWRGLRRKPKVWLFPGTAGTRPTTPSQARSSGQHVTKRLRAPALAMIFIRTRYGTASPRICSKHAELRTIRILLGHRGLEETTIYLHLSNRHLSATASPLDALLLSEPAAGKTRNKP